MGFDCTLHVVDETSFQRFCARFLSGKFKFSAFDHAFDAKKLIDGVRTTIKKDPVQGARDLGQLALMFVSAEYPHVKARGLALSLWDTKAMGAPLPARLLGNVETQLQPILKRHPTLAGKVPSLFDGNYSVGAYVGADKVPALLAHVERTVAAMVPGARAPYQALVTVLRAAAARKLAYWEATDLAVANVDVDWLEEPKPVTTDVRIEKSPIGHYPQPRAVDRARMFVFEQWRFHTVDQTKFPPKVTTEEVQVTVAAATPWGTVLRREARDQSTRPWPFANVEVTGKKSKPVLADLPFELGQALPTRDAVLLFPGRFVTPQASHRPYVWRGKTATALEVPAPKKKEHIYWAHAFGDGSTLVLWDGRAYRWTGKGAPKALDITLGEPVDQLSVVTLADSSIVGAFGRKLIRITPDGTTQRILTLDNVMQVFLGPDDALVLVEGDHPEDDVLKIWWPSSREVTLVDRAVTGTGQPRIGYYDAPRAQLVLADTAVWHGVPWSTLSALPRISAKDYAAERKKLVARMKKRRR